MRSVKTWITYFLFMAAALGLAAQTRALNDGWLWANGTGGSGEDEAWSVCPDAAGNVYVAGFFSGLANFGSWTLGAIGGSDAFVARMSPAGEWLWAISFGDFGNERVNCIRVDAMGYIYVTGSFDNNLQLPGLAAWP